MTKNVQLETLVRGLKRLSLEQGVRLWKRVATDLEKSSRRRRVVNVFKLDQYTKDGDIVVVPGKVLGEGEFTKKVTVAAYRFSEDAKAKIAKSGKAISIDELMKQNPKGQKVRILG